MKNGEQRAGPQASTATDVEGGGAPSRPDWVTLLLMAVWFGVVAGLIEGWGLLLFQKINWQQWGGQVHVSLPILWISTLVDSILFLLVVLGIGVAARLWPRLPAFRLTVFALTALTLYDWASAPNRLYHIASLLLALGVATVFSRWAAGHEVKAARFWRRTAPWAAALAVLAFAGIHGGTWLLEREQLARLPSAAPDAPNVLVIIIDTLRADHVSSYGYSRPTTPNIDRLAKAGVLFENAVSTSSWSYPSHVSLVTGKYAFENGAADLSVMTMRGNIATDFNGCETIGEAFQARGYRTGAFSANRIYFSRDLGFKRGFIHFEDYFQSPADMFLRTGFGREFERWVLSRSYDSRPKRLLRLIGLGALEDLDDEGSGPNGTNPARKRASVVNQEVLDWIDKNHSHPFLAVLNYFDVHNTYGGPPSYPKPSWRQDRPVDQYDDGIKYVDDYVGKLIAGLEKRGVARKTLVVVTSDHGDLFGGHGLTLHGKALYWNLIHVPLIFWYPGHVPAGVRVPTVVSNSAIASTVLQEAGAPASDWPGISSLAALWNGPATGNAEWPDVLSELAYDGLRAQSKAGSRFSVPTNYAGPMKTVVSGDWQLIVHKQLGDQLYDWVRDPDESDNLINTPVGGRISGELIPHLQDMLAGGAPPGNLVQVAYRLAGGDSVYTRNITSPARLNDYYHIRAEAGSRIRVEVQAARKKAPAVLDPVVSIENEAGKVFQTCRNPGDDHIPPPGVADPTPDAFDDVCVNDDVKPGDTDSSLELLVPGGTKGPVDLYLNVSDWTGRIVQPGASYEIAVSGAADQRRPDNTLVSRKLSK